MNEMDIKVMNYNCRGKDANPADYVATLTQFQDAGPNLLKRSKITGNKSLTCVNSLRTGH